MQYEISIYLWKTMLSVICANIAFTEKIVSICVTVYYVQHVGTFQWLISGPHDGIVVL